MKYLVTFLILVTSIQCAFAESGFGVSAAFTMDTVDPILQITNPTLMQECLYGEELPISWNLTETNPSPNDVIVSWRPNPPTAWQQLAQFGPPYTEYLWTIQEDGTTQAEIKVSLSDSFGNSGTAISEPFIILPHDEPQEVSITSTPAGASVYIDGALQGTTPFSTIINPDSTFVVSVQKLGYSFIPSSQVVVWLGEPQSFHFTGTFTYPGTIVNPFNIPDIWVLADSPYNIVEPIVLESHRNITMQEGVEVSFFIPDTLQVFGSLNATEVSFIPAVDTLHWGGIEIIGGDRTISQLNGCHIINALIPLLVRDSNPLITDLQITLTDTTEVMYYPGILIEGDSAPSFDNVLISNYETGVKIIANLLTGQSSPTMSNIRIRNTNSSIRTLRDPENYDPKGMWINGNSNVTLTNVEILDYLTGIKAENETLPIPASPTMNTIRISNTGTGVHAPSCGIALNGLQNANLSDLQIDYYNQGVVIDNSNPSLGSSPTMSNIRIRNTNSSIREESIGILVSNNVLSTIRDCYISYADIGVMDLSSTSLDIQNSTLKNCKKGYLGFLPDNPVLKKNLFLAEQSWADSQAVDTVYGVEVLMGTNFNVHNNTFYGYPKLIKLNTSTGIFENNIAWKSSTITSPFQLINSSMVVRYNNIRASQSSFPSPGAIGNINTDPLFLNLIERDFHLHYNSPCIDTGNPASTSDSDGTRNDMGAFPYLHLADFSYPGSSVLNNHPLSFTNTSQGHNDATTLVKWDLLDNGSFEAFTRDWTTSFPSAGIYPLKLTMITGNITDHSPIYNIQVIDANILETPGSFSGLVEAGRIILSWDDVPGAQVYKIFSATDPDALWTEVNSSEGIFGESGNRITWTTSTGGSSKRFYRVVAFSP